MSEIWPRPRVRNEFVYELKDGLFDRLFYLQVFDSIADISKPTTRCNTSDHPALQAVKERYPFLSGRCDLLAVPANFGWRGLHVDGTWDSMWNRMSALNIPLYAPGTCESDTEFWTMRPGCKIQEYIDLARNITTRGADIEQCDKAFVHQLNVPTIIDTQTPHTVHNRATFLRKVLSFGSTLTFPETVKAFKVSK